MEVRKFYKYYSDPPERKAFSPLASNTTKQSWWFSKINWLYPLEHCHHYYHHQSPPRLIRGFSQRQSKKWAMKRNCFFYCPLVPSRVHSISEPTSFHLSFFLSTTRTMILSLSYVCFISFLRFISALDLSLVFLISGFRPASCLCLVNSWKKQSAGAHWCCCLTTPKRSGEGDYYWKKKSPTALFSYELLQSPLTVYDNPDFSHPRSVLPFSFFSQTLTNTSWHNFYIYSVP